jgi:putative transposase
MCLVSEWTRQGGAKKVSENPLRNSSAEEKALLSVWPQRRSAGWVEHVNSPQTDAGLTALRRSVNRDSPFGDETWATIAKKKLGLEITTRPQGRPKLK